MLPSECAGRGVRASPRETRATLRRSGTNNRAYLKSFIRWLPVGFEHGRRHTQLPHELQTSFNVIVLSPRTPGLHPPG